MTLDHFRIFRWRLRLIAQFTRQTGEPQEFLETGITMWEPAADAAALRKFAEAYNAFRAAALEALPVLSPSNETPTASKGDRDETRHRS
jgi:hypothetical protein